MSFNDNCYQYSGLNLDALDWRKSFMIPGCFCCFFFQDFSTKIHYVSNEIHSRFKIDFMKTAQSWFLRRGSQILREELQLLQSRFWKTKNFKLFGNNFEFLNQAESSDRPASKVKWDGQSRVFTWWITTSKADTLVCLKCVFFMFFKKFNKLQNLWLWSLKLGGFSDSPMTWGQIASANSKLDVSHSSQMFSWNWTYSVCTAQEVFCILGWPMWCSHTSQSEYEVIRNHEVYMESQQE